MTNCEFPAQCVNTGSGFSCICSDGYVGVPPQCEGECSRLPVYDFALIREYRNVSEL